MTTEQGRDFLAQFDLEAGLIQDGIEFKIDPEWLFGCHRTDSKDDWFRTFAITAVRNHLSSKLNRVHCLQLCASVLRTTVQELENSMDSIAYQIHCTEGVEMEAVHTWPKSSEDA